MRFLFFDVFFFTVIAFGQQNNTVESKSYFLSSKNLIGRRTQFSKFLIEKKTG